MSRYRGSIKIGNRLFDLSEPCVMAIINLTPDSFYEASRMEASEALALQVRRMTAEGAAIIDVGACSTRPGSEPTTQEEEMSRLRSGLPFIMREVNLMNSQNALKHTSPYRPVAVSVDTFRADVARMCVEEYGVDIINDISGGDADKHMFKTVASLRVPYVLTHNEDVTHERHMLPSMMLYLSRRIMMLRDTGVADIIIDPGFGFGKTMRQNYEIMNSLESFEELLLPLLVGISRKSMLWRLFETTPSQTLNATTALHAFALQKGARILRVHDVKEAVEAVVVYKAMIGQTL